MNNIEFVSRYQTFKEKGILNFEPTADQVKIIESIGRLGINDLSDEQLLTVITEIPAFIENLRIAVHCAENTARERGREIRAKQRESDQLLDSYSAPYESKLDALEKEMSKKGKSAAQIEKVKKLVDSIDFDDI